MKLVFVTEGRFFKDQEGVIYGDASFEQDIWTRYLRVFDEVFVVARVENEAQNVEQKYISSGPKIHFIEIPYYIGPLQYILKFFQIKNKIKILVNEHVGSAFICRIPGMMGNMVINELAKYNKNYGLEIVGDPDEVFSDDSFKHPLKKFFHQNGVKNLKKNIAGAKSCLYVTKNTLQKKYPPPANSFSTFASNVMLSSNSSIQKPKTLTTRRRLNVLSAGSLEQMYKAPDIVLNAVKIYNEKYPSTPINFTWLGEGKYLQRLETLRLDLNLNNFLFKGQVSSLEVEIEMKQADLFVLASRTEGLPRVVVEAMAHGLPVIGSKVGGIPELLSENTLIEKNNPEALADMMFAILSQPEYYSQLSFRNLTESQEYTYSILSARRDKFYSSLKV